MSAAKAQTPAPKALPVGNPKDSMKSTWRQDPHQWTSHNHWLMNLLNIHQSDPAVDPPVFKKTDKVPHLPEWKLHRYVLIHTFTPLAIHQLITSVTKWNMHPLVAYGFYNAAFSIIGLHQLRRLRTLGQKYGYLDGDKAERDEVPDVGVSKVMDSLSYTSLGRAAITIFLTYKQSQAPMDMNWKMLPLQVGMYGVVLDFWFYWYHRVMHEFDSLWKYHRTHHLTKHPNALLTLYADHEQEFFDIVGIPLMTYFAMRVMGVPLGFYEWWICQQYVTFTELSGHSGLRLHTTPPSTVGWLLRLFGCELVIEDHDLHHRRGWKKSGNYGKQTRLWDRLFGTFLPRIECTADNIDYVNTADFPWF